MPSTRSAASCRWAYCTAQGQRVPPIKYRLPCPRKYREERQTCVEAGCDELTTRRKPYCVKHIHLMPYVATLDRNLLVNQNPIYDDSVRQQCLALRARGLTVRAIAAHLGISKSTAHGWVKQSQQQS